MSRIPGPEDMDAAWLTDRLRGNGYPGVTVTSVARTQIGTGQVGKCIRFDLGHTGDESAPSSLVGKFASDDPTSRETGIQLGNYHREVKFYQQLADQLSITIPRCYFADIEGEGADFALLLEDMSPAEPGNQLIGCSPEVARLSVLELVGLQAPFWCDQQLEQYDFLTFTEISPTALIELYAQLLGGFIDRYGDALAPDEREIIRRVGNSPACPLFQPPGRPFCLEHVDYRLDNMLIDTNQTPPKVTVVDWQSVRVGKPMNDVAYFLGAGLLPDARREAETDIVRDYHAKLTAAGIGDYSWEDCWQDYRRGSFSGFGVTVIASMIVQQTKRGDEMFIAMARRHARHALDLGADEFLA